MRGLLAFVVIAVGLAALVVVAVKLRGPYQSKKELRAEGDAIVRGLKQYKTQHGHYPASLAEAGLTPAVTAYGPWEYSRDDRDDSFSLSVGDYGRDGFCLSFEHRNGWYLDE
jgi:hypothetical protein